MMQVYILVYCSWSSAFNFDFQSMASGDKYNKLDEDYEIQVQEYIKLTLQIKWGGYRPTNYFLYIRTQFFLIFLLHSFHIRQCIVVNY